MRKIHAFFLLTICCHASIAAYLPGNQEKSLVVKAYILQPPCRLKSITSDINFDEVSMVDVIAGKVVEDIRLDFQYCLNTTNINITFNGTNLSSKYNALTVNHQEGGSSGILIKLLNSGSEIDLMKGITIPARALDVSYFMNAKVIPIHSELVTYNPGFFKSSVGLTIQYD